MVPDPATIESLRRTWSNRLVKVTRDVPTLQRFAGKVGRVITVNLSGRAIVDFGDGGWYDLPDFASVLIEVTDPDEAKQYDPSVNSAQKNPVRQA
jgi:hypothetical protein